MVTLETARLRLRPFEERDLDAFAQMCADPKVMRFLTGKPMSRLETWRSIAAILGHWQLRGFGMWAVEESESGTFVGRVGFIHPEGWPGFELGWALARSAWGRGFATEAARRALEYAFEELDKDHVISLIHPENLRSMAVAERLGERHEETIEFLGNETLIYGIRRSE